MPVTTNFEVFANNYYKSCGRPVPKKDPGLTITPISKKFKGDVAVCSKRDYATMITGKRWWWDDHTNHHTHPTGVGDYLAFMFWEDKLVFHEVIDIMSPNHRPTDWSQTDRPVLILSKPLFTLDWEQWISERTGGLLKRQGTYKVNWTCGGLDIKSRKTILRNHVRNGFKNVHKQ